MSEIGCPTTTIVNAVGSLRNPAVEEKVIDHVNRCEKCRTINHKKTCVPYSVIHNLNTIMPSKMTSDQARAIKDCKACMLLINADTAKIMNNILGH